jgi:hypothetical protein
VAKLREAEKLQAQGFDDPPDLQAAADLGADLLSLADVILGEVKAEPKHIRQEVP